MENKSYELGNKSKITLSSFFDIVYQNASVFTSDETTQRLNESRYFIDYLLKNNIKVYGLTTGFADLRDCAVSAEQASELSHLILQSHDAGIGESIPHDVTLGAMVLRAQSLAQGYSGFRNESLQTLIQMINSRVIPLIPSTGSLGASGDLAFLARLGRAMEGQDVPVYYQGKVIPAHEALSLEKISPFSPQAKEGLALTNGTSFMISMTAIAYLRQINVFENLLILQGLFLNATKGIDAAFMDSIHAVRGQKGQREVASVLIRFLENSPFIDRKDVQNDYCIRCIPQIMGPKLEILIEQYPKIIAEMNAVTDNPLIFRRDELSKDIPQSRKISFNGEDWAVLSGGNFHGEYLTSIADNLTAANAKVALMIERQMTYMLNPARNKKSLPTYLIDSGDQVGLNSGYMIPHYTANALTQKICQLGIPTSIFNITSANESEDVVSYGASAAQRWLSQLEHLEHISHIYLVIVAQAYGLARKQLGLTFHDFLAEDIFNVIQDHFNHQFPTKGDRSFESRYLAAEELLNTKKLSQASELSLLAMITGAGQLAEIPAIQ